MLATSNNAAINTLQNTNFISTGYITRSGIAITYDSSIFNFLKKFLLFSILTALIYIPTHSIQRFLFLHALTNTSLSSFCHFVLVSVRWYLLVVLICIPQLISDIEPFFHIPVDHLHIF